MTYILGLTGSIGTGKSTVSRILQKINLPVFDADQIVDSIYQEDTSFLKAMKSAYPHYIIHSRINKQAIAQEAFQNEPLLAWLQKNLHKRVHKHSHNFIKAHRNQNTPLAVLNIPLLFEAGFHTLCDSILVTTCEESLQQERVLKRPFMSLNKYQAILKYQWPQAKKNAKATWILSTNGSLRSVVHQLRQIKDNCQRRLSLI